MDMYGISSATLHENELHAQNARLREINADNFAEANKKYTLLEKQQESKDTGINEETIVPLAGDIQKAGTVISAGYGAGKAILTGAAVGADVSTTLSAAKQAVSDVGGAAKGIGGKLEGLEGIGQNILKSGGAAEELAFVGGKALGNVGAIVDIVKAGDDYMQTGNLFKSKGPDGKITEESDLDITGDALTVAAGVADVATFFTGGLLAPVAAVLSLAAAGTSLVGTYEDEKASDAVIAGLKPTLKVTVDAAPYTSLGFVGNQSHDPVRALSQGRASVF